MCGRFTLNQSGSRLAERFQVAMPVLRPRFNVAPSQPVLAVRMQAGAREAVFLRWGLVPRKGSARTALLINARSETVFDKASFRESARLRRCLVPADGFFEWKTLATKAGAPAKLPFRFQVDGGEIFAFAGVWTTEPGQQASLESLAILTTEANPLVAPVHDRMPVIVAPEYYGLWLDPALREREPLEQLLIPFAAERMTATPVSSRVNDPRHDDADCLGPAEPELIRRLGQAQLGFGF